MMKNGLPKIYVAAGALVCLWFAVAAFAGWKAPNLGILDGRSGFGRTSGGYWGGGK